MGIRTLFALYARALHSYLHTFQGEGRRACTCLHYLVTTESRNMLSTEVVTHEQNGDVIEGIWLAQRWAQYFKGERKRFILRRRVRLPGGKRKRGTLSWRNQLTSLINFRTLGHIIEKSY